MLDVYVLSLSILGITTVFEKVYDFYVGCMVYSLGFRHLSLYLGPPCINNIG